jgi:UDP-glucose 4-epimerase
VNCLILGGAGFIGSHLADALLGRGHRVRVFDLPNISLGNLQGCIVRVEVVGGDFGNSLDLLPALEAMDVVVHLVCTTLPGPSNENPEYDVETNIVSTLRLLRMAVEAGVKKIVFASSGGTVYGIPRVIPIPESHPTNPTCSYGITKLTIEKYLELYHRLHGLDYAVLRFGNPYGERQRIDSVQGAIAVFLGKVARDKEIAIWGDGSVARDYFYISDLLEAVVLVIESEIRSSVYNIGSGQAYSLNDLLAVIEGVTGKRPAVSYTEARTLDVPVNCLDISRARQELGWEPRVPLREGMARTWEWIQENIRGRM